jgi:hypothetical protein
MPRTGRGEEEPGCRTTSGARAPEPSEVPGLVLLLQLLLLLSGSPGRGLLRFARHASLAIRYALGKRQLQGPVIFWGLRLGSIKVI